MRDSAKRLGRAVPTGCRGLAPSVSEKPLPLSLGSPAALPAASRGRMAPVSQGVFMTLIPRTDLDVFPLNLGGNTFGWTSDRERSEEPRLNSSHVANSYAVFSLK